MPTRPLSHEARERSKRSPAVRKEERDRRYSNNEQDELRKLRSSARWQKTREWHLRREPLCVDPFGVHAAEGHVQQGEEVHHIKPAVNNPDLFFDFENLTTLCIPCHGRLERKTLAQQRIYLRNKTYKQKGGEL